MATVTNARCHHCDAPVSTREIADGWCDSCGKKLPFSLQAEVKRNAPLHAPAVTAPDEPAARGGRGLVWGGLVLVLVSLAAALVVYVQAR